MERIYIGEKDSVFLNTIPTAVNNPMKAQYLCKIQISIAVRSHLAFIGGTLLKHSCETPSEKMPRPVKTSQRTTEGGETGPFASERGLMSYY
jgi:hypothetical protein